MAQVPPFTNLDPETAATLSAAYDEAVARLLDQPDVVHEHIAERLIALAAQRIVNPLLNESRCSLCRRACCSRHRIENRIEPEDRGIS